MTLYEELELTPDCSFEDIKQQYRTLARIHHPDLGGDEEKFKRIKFAYEVLSDPVRRKQYDETKSTTAQPNIHAEAIGNLANIFFAIIPHFDCRGGNLVEAMTNEINTLQRTTTEELQRNEVFIENLNIIKGKLQMKNPSDENIILSFVDKQLETRIADEKFLRYRVTLLDEMLNIVLTHKYGFTELFNEQPVEVTENETKTQ